MSESGPIRVEAGEWTADEFLAALKEGRRVVVQAEFMGETRDVALRWDGETFYCDSPTRLHKHQTEDGMAECLHKLGYTAEAAAGDPGTAGDGADAGDA